ncbi:MAG TPA: pyridoxamine 5'-phosphate oxidase [Pyrinomonadaceae bacterium]|jgi:pyridoxamine 5'-phosphate oxidase|nr:pyridoxamine 5'-phosphate oxidase [Pyrinomonadaceae bacterium]
MTTLSSNPAVEGLDEKTIDRDPIKQFQTWLDEAFAAKLPLAEAMTLATVAPDGKPSARMVLLKQVDHDGFVFYTNYNSAKAQQLDANPYAALVFYWTQFDRQVRVEGSVTRTSREESRAYFATRPRESQIGAWASEQSEVIESRAALEERAVELERQYGDREIDCPEHWGGYRLKPERIEFWKSRIGRLHDRILYQRDGDTWTITRLAP